MKSKSAEEYIDKNIYDAAECVDKDGCGWAVVKRSDAYRAVELAEDELIRLNDPKMEFPDPDIEVLVKIDAPYNKYDIMKHNEHGWWQKAPGGGWCAPKYKPVGWRHIHEL